MTDKYTKVETVMVHKMCDCGGEFKSEPAEDIGGIFAAMFRMETPKYKHTCDKCGAEVELEDSYPRVKQLEVPCDIKDGKLVTYHTVRE